MSASLSYPSRIAMPRIPRGLPSSHSGVSLCSTLSRSLPSATSSSDCFVHLPMVLPSLCSGLSFLSSLSQALPSHFRVRCSNQLTRQFPLARSFGPCPAGNSPSGFPSPRGDSPVPTGSVLRTFSPPYSASNSPSATPWPRGELSRRH